jgi:hypothetical protein
MWAKEGIEKGEEVCFYYGDHCREESVMIYGFAGEWQHSCDEDNELLG